MSHSIVNANSDTDRIPHGDLFWREISGSMPARRRHDHSPADNGYTF